MALVIAVVTQTVSGALLSAGRAWASEAAEMPGLAGEVDEPLLRGIVLDPFNPLHATFIIDAPSGKTVSQTAAARLIRYFMAGLTVPDDELWVNLSPYEPDRILAQSLRSTEMGEDLLEQDYVLKQLAAGLTHPDAATGRKYWNGSHDKTRATGLNKVWIVPNSAFVSEQGATAVITDADLRVLTEEDYNAVCSDEDVSAQLNKISAAKDMRISVIPELEREVNKGRRFTRLRQIYHSLILAMWFKQKLKDSLYADYIDKSKVVGIDLGVPEQLEIVYSRYLEVFTKGVYDVIRKEIDPVTGRRIKRRYVSGGFHLLTGGSWFTVKKSASALKELPLKNYSLVETAFDPVHVSSSLYKPIRLLAAIIFLSQFIIDCGEPTPVGPEVDHDNDTTQVDTSMVDSVTPPDTGTIDGVDSVDSYLAVLHGRSKFTSEEGAAKWLGKNADTSIVEELGKIMVEKSLYTTAEAAVSQAIWDIAERYNDEFSYIMLLKYGLDYTWMREYDYNPFLQESGKWLGLYGAAESAQALFQIADSSYGDRHKQAYKALIEIGERADDADIFRGFIARMTEPINSSDLSYFISSARWLGVHGDPGMVDTLKTLYYKLHTDLLEEKIDIVDAIGVIGGKQARAAVAEIYYRKKSGSYDPPNDPLIDDALIRQLKRLYTGVELSKCSLEELRLLLKSDDFTLQSGASQILFAVGDSVGTARAVEDIVKPRIARLGMNDMGAAYGSEAFNQLRQLGGVAVQSLRESAIQSEDDNVRIWSLHLLGLVDSFSSAFGFLNGVAKNSVSEFAQRHRSAAVRGLINAFSKMPVDTTRPYLESDDAHLVTAACFAMAVLDADSARVMYERVVRGYLATKSNPWLYDFRLEAVERLGDLGDEATIALLTDVSLNDPDAMMRAQAERSIEKIKSRTSSALSLKAKVLLVALSLFMRCGITDPEPEAFDPAELRTELVQPTSYESFLSAAAQLQGLSPNTAATDILVQLLSAIVEERAPFDTLDIDYSVGLNAVRFLSEKGDAAAAEVMVEFLSLTRIDEQGMTRNSYCFMQREVIKSLILFARRLKLSYPAIPIVVYGKPDDWYLEEFIDSVKPEAVNIIFFEVPEDQRLNSVYHLGEDAGIDAGRALLYYLAMDSSQSVQDSAYHVLESLVDTVMREFLDPVASVCVHEADTFAATRTARLLLKVGDVAAYRILFRRFYWEGTSAYDSTNSVKTAVMRLLDEAFDDGRVPLLKEVFMAEPDHASRGAIIDRLCSIRTVKAIDAAIDLLAQDDQLKAQMVRDYYKYNRLEILAQTIIDLKGKSALQALILEEDDLDVREIWQGILNAQPVESSSINAGFYGPEGGVAMKRIPVAVSGRMEDFPMSRVLTNARGLRLRIRNVRSGFPSVD